MASAHPVKAMIRRLALAAAMAGLCAGAARAQQVVVDQVPVLTLFTHGVTLTHHLYTGGFCDFCDFDTHRLVERQITIFSDGSLRSVDSFNELEDGLPAFASSVSGKGSTASFNALLAALQSAQLASQAGRCSFPAVIEREQAEPNYDDVIHVNHDAYFTWFASGSAPPVELVLDSQGPVCPTDLEIVLFSVVNYEQEVIADTPHVAARP